MQMIDTLPLGGGPRITLEQIQVAGQRYSANPMAFAMFAAGIRPHSDLLLDGQLTRPVGASGRYAFFDYVMHRILPGLFSPDHLAQLGGRFALRIDGVGSYTLTMLNRRIITLKGLPHCPDGKPLADSSIRADAFLGLFNQMLADLATQVLTQNTPTEADHTGTTDRGIHP
ncbi:MAG: hypothetical protein ACFB11_04085 [Paracoccaceae bacterium]